MKANLHRLSQVGLIALVVILTTRCNGSLAEIRTRLQGGNTGGVTRIVPAIQGKATGKVLPFSHKGGNLKSEILAHPVPEVWLVFPAAETSAKTASSDPNNLTVKVELPPEASSELQLQWKTALAFYYYEAKPEGATTPDSDVKESLAYAKSFGDTERKLYAMQIDTPTGKRNISFDEAGDIVAFIGASAGNLVKQATQQAK